MRFPSDETIRARAALARLRGQALARNEDYESAIDKLKTLGLRFGPDGFTAIDGVLSWGLCDAIYSVCRRATLILPVLPDKLKALTLDEILKYDEHHVFPDVPGWTIEPKDARRFKAAVQRSARLLLPAAGDLSVALTAEDDRSAAPRTGDVDQRLDDEFAEDFFREKDRSGFVATNTRQFRAGVIERAAPGDLVRYQVVLLGKLTKRHRGPDRSIPEDLFAQYWRVYDLRKAGKNECEILRDVWPTEERAEAPSSDKTPRRQRVYDYLHRAKELIAAAYPPETDRS